MPTKLSRFLPSSATVSAKLLLAAIATFATLSPSCHSSPPKDEPTAQVARALAEPNWTPGVTYQVGDLVQFQGIVYECRQTHTAAVGWEPPNVISLWQRPTPTDPGPTPWAVQVHYVVGSDVTYGGSLWECTTEHVSQSDWFPGAATPPILWRKAGSGPTACQGQPDGALCDDGKACNVDTCQAGVCVGSGQTCGGSIVDTVTDVGTLPGGVSVSQSGSSSYVIPLWAPEGRNGMTPHLGLAYSSTGGDSPVGYGWSLTGGMSMIHRCSMNSTRSQRPNPVKFDSTDRLCLDGKPLVLINTVPNGAAGAEYRTEPESFTKVVIDAVGTDGPTRFTVFTRDGLKHFYASATVTQVDTGLVVGGKRDEWTASDATRDDSAIVKTNPGAQYGWLRGSIEDRFHNTIRYKYIHPTSKDAIGGKQEPLLDNIEYVDEGTTPTRVIKFKYDDRDQISRRTGFIGGLGFSGTKKLSSIDMLVKGPTAQSASSVRFYELTQLTSATTGRSLLQQVREADGNPASVTGRTPVFKRATTFGYQGGFASFQDVPVEVKNLRRADDSDFWGIQPADMNHDGLDDIVYRARPEGAPTSEPPHWFVRLSTGTSFSNPIDLNLPAGKNLQTGDAVIADFSGDGMPDIAVPAGNAGDNVLAFYENVSIANGAALFKLMGAVEASAPNKGLTIDDFAGKGRAAVLRPTMDGRWSYRALQFTIDGATLSDSSDPLNVAWPSNFAQAGWSIYSADVDFDGAAEFLAPAVTPPGGSPPNRLSILKQKTIPASATPTASDWEILPTKSTLLTSTDGNLVSHFFLDQNGDGLPDAIRLRQGSLAPELIINSGAGLAKPEPIELVPATTATVGAGATANDVIDPGIRVLDFDGDGRQDILLVDNGVPRDSSLAPPATPPRSNLTLLLSAGSSLGAVDLGFAIGLPADGPVKPTSPGIHNYRQTQVLDMNGDGLPDIVQFFVDGTFHVLVRQGAKPDLLTDVKDGMGKKTKVTYLPMTNPAVYTLSTNCGFPETCAVGDDWFVRSVKTDNGIGGGQNEVLYHYNDRRMDALGAGILGFKSWTVQDVASATVVEETFDFSKKGLVKEVGAAGTPQLVPVFSQIGLPVTRTVTTTGADFVRTTTSTLQYEFVATNTGWSYYSRPSSVTTDQVETKGGATTTLFTRTDTFTPNSAFNDFGVPPDVVSSILTPQGDFEEETSSSYLNLPDKWLLGLETSRTVTSATPAEGPIGQRLDFTPDQDTGLPTQMIVEPADTTGDKYLRVDFGRNSFGEPHTITRTDLAGNARTDTLDYDAQSVHVAKFTNALGHVSTVDPHPGLGVILSTIDPNGIKTTFDYDGYGRLRRVNLPGGGGQSITFVRDVEAGSNLADERFVAKLTTTVDGGGTQTRFLNRLGQDIRGEVKNFDGSLSYSTLTYSDLGLLTTMTRPAKVIPGTNNPGATTTFQYDVLGRLLSRTRPEDGFDKNGSPVTSATATTVYDAFTSTSTDDFDRITKTITDSFGRPIRTEVTNDLNKAVATEFVYGAFGVLRFATRTDGAGTSTRTTEAQYDNLGRRLNLIDPDTGKRVVGGQTLGRLTAYNAFGEVREETDANGNVTTYIHDRLGRISQKTDLDGVTTFTWDSNGLGLLAEALSPSGVRRRFTYDVAGRMSRETWTMVGQSFQVDYSFDSFGRVQKISYPDSSGFSRFVVRNSYNVNSGDLSKVLNDSTGAAYWELKKTKVDGQIDQEAFGNTALTDYTYSDQTGRLGTIKTTRPGSSPTTLRSWSYDYWKDGNLRRRSDLKAGQHERFEYDAMDRIKTWLAATSSGAAMSGGWKVNYTLDDFGNLTRRQFVAGSATGGTSQDLSFTLVPGTDRVQSAPWGSYSYDNNGNQTGRPGGEAVTYTAFDLPKTMTGPQPATFLYDAFGTRAKKRKSDTDYTLYVAGLYEKRIAGSAIDHVFYVVGGGRVVAQVMRREGGSESTRYLHDDHLGSVDAVTDSGAAVVESTKRDPYGNKVTNFNQPTLPSTIMASTNKVRLGFTEHEQDDELGLVNMRGRVYDPRLARFLTPDPFVQAPAIAHHHNRYAYVWNNPLKRTDPSGLLQPDDPNSVTCTQYGCGYTDGAGVWHKVWDSEYDEEKGEYRAHIPDAHNVSVTDTQPPTGSPPDHGGNGDAHAGRSGNGRSGASNGAGGGAPPPPKPPTPPKKAQNCSANCKGPTRQGNVWTNPRGEPCIGDYCYPTGAAYHYEGWGTPGDVMARGGFGDNLRLPPEWLVEAGAWGAVGGAEVMGEGVVAGIRLAWAARTGATAEASGTTIMLGRFANGARARLAREAAGRGASIVEAEGGTREAWYASYRAMRTADRILMNLKDVPKSLEEAREIGGWVSRAEKMISETRPDLACKTETFIK